MELDVGAGLRQKAGWRGEEEQEEAGLGVSRPTRLYLLQSIGCGRPRDFCRVAALCCQQKHGEPTGKGCDHPACSLSAG